MSGGERKTLDALLDLEQSDAFILGWEQSVVLKLREMRKQLPGAQTLHLRLEESWPELEDQ